LQDCDNLSPRDAFALDKNINNSKDDVEQKAQAVLDHQMWVVGRVLVHITIPSDFRRLSI